MRTSESRNMTPPIRSSGPVITVKGAISKPVGEAADGYGEKARSR
jgi:hypothetical protein